MATVIGVDIRRDEDFLVYPSGFSHAACPCLACQHPFGALVKSGTEEVLMARKDMTKENLADLVRSIADGRGVAVDELDLEKEIEFRGFGNCRAAQKKTVDVVRVRLSDSRVASLVFDQLSPSDADITARLAKWMGDNPAHPLMGRNV